MQDLTYKDAGVDVELGEKFVASIAASAKSTMRPGANPTLGSFGAMFDLRETSFADPVLVAGTDGVGTKVLLAIRNERHRSIGIDCVAMCVNDVVVHGAEPLFFLDYLAAARIDLTRNVELVAGIADGCRMAGCALIGGESAEHPGMSQADVYDLAGFCVGAVERDAMLPVDNIAEGDVILGLASSGLHANGFSLVRRVLETTGLSLHDPSPVDPSLSLADVLLEPTRIYVPACLAAMRQSRVKAFCHVTGGGLTHNVPRVLPHGTGAIIDTASWSVPPLFIWLSNPAPDIAINPSEMLSTFNCGIGMIAIVDRTDADDVVAVLESCGEQVMAIGSVVATDTAPSVTYTAMADTWRTI